VLGVEDFISSSRVRVLSNTCRKQVVEGNPECRAGLLRRSTDSLVDNTAGEGIKELEHDITRNDVF